MLLHGLGRFYLLNASHPVALFDEKWGKFSVGYFWKSAVCLFAEWQGEKGEGWEVKQKMKSEEGTWAED